MEKQSKFLSRLSSVNVYYCYEINRYSDDIINKTICNELN